jgi:nuclear pore complex protein Nup93
VSLSLTSVDDPVALAKIIIKLYSSNQMYGNRIKQTNGETCNILLTISEAKIMVEHGRWTEALDVGLLSQICQIKA